MSTNSEVQILLVEDNPRDAELAMRSLKKRNLTNKLVWVKDGEEALDFIFGPRGGNSRVRNRPKIILLDLKLPKVDGLEVLRRVKGDAQLKKMPVVILSTSAVESDVTAAYALGAGGYLVKPIDFEKFHSLLEAFGFYWLAWNRSPH